MENQYTIIYTVHHYGSLTMPVKKESVREECERLRLSSNLGNQPKNTFICIEVVNNETGEIREYWNNHDNKLEF